MTKWYWSLCLAVILLIGTIVRFYSLGEIPVSLYWDEAAILADARAIAATSKDLHGNHWLQAIFPSYGDYKLPMYIWLTSLCVRFFGNTEWALRLPSAIAGIGTILIAGSIAKELFYTLSEKRKKVLFLIVSSVVAIAPWSIFFSRTGFEAHVGQFFLAISMWFALKMRITWQWGMGAVIFGAAATYSYFSVQFVWPIIFLTTVLLFTSPRKKYFLRWFFLCVLTPLAGYWLFLQPLSSSPLAELSRQFRLSTLSVINKADWPVIANQYRLQSGNMWWDKAVYHPLVLQGRELMKNYADFISFDFLFLSGDPNLRHGTGHHGLFLWVTAPFFLYGWYSLFPKYWKQAILLLAWWATALLPAAVPETTPHALRSLNALVPLAIVIGWGYWRTYNIWQNLPISRFWKWSSIAGLIASTLLVFTGWTQYYWQIYPTRSSQEWQAGYKEVTHAVWESRNESDSVWFRSSDDHMYLWLLAHHVPTKEFSSIQYHAYKPDKIGTITLGFPSLDELTSLGHSSAALIAEEEYLKRELEIPGIPSHTFEILPIPALRTFSIAHFERMP